MKKLLLILLAVVAGATTAKAGDFVELLTNGNCDGTYDGWQVTNGGSGWGIGTDEYGDNYWASSYQECRLEQTVSLPENITAEDVDNSLVEIMASAMIRATWESGSQAATVCNVYVEMQDADGNELSSITVYNDLSIQPNWYTAATYPTLLVPGTRQLKYVVRGKDIKTWGGQYGPKFKNLSLKIRVGEAPVVEEYQELLTNGNCNGTYDNWTVTNDGNGWAINHDEENDFYYWVSSHKPCMLEQTVDLNAKGFSSTDIDAGKVYCVASAQMRSPWEKNGLGANIANVYVEMIDAEGNVTNTVIVVDDKSYIPDWRLYRTGTFLVYPGTRQLKYVVRGQDAKNWGGQYGPQFKDLSLMAKLGSAYDCSEYGHIWGQWTTSGSSAPTCTTPGYQVHYCLFCGLEETGNESPALGHDWGDWEITQQPTCTDTGIQSHTCQRCGATEDNEEPVPALGHDWGEPNISVQPNCTEPGLMNHTCQRCGLEENDVPIPPLGHTWGADGVCTVCGATLEIPEDITLLNSIRSTGNQYFNTNYIHKANTVMELDCAPISNSQRDYEGLFGARLRNYNSNSFTFFSRYGGNNRAYFSRTGAETASEQAFVYDERIRLVATGQTATWYKASDPTTVAGSVTTNGTADDGQTPMVLFNINTASEPGGCQLDVAASVMKLYGCKIYEDETLVHDFRPAKRDGVVGLYDMLTGSFAGSGTDTPFEEGDTPHEIEVKMARFNAVVDCPTTAIEGESVEFTVTCEEGTKVYNIDAWDENNKTINTSCIKEEGRMSKYSFVMPEAKVTISITVSYDPLPTVITEIPSDYAVTTYLRNNICYYNGYWGYSIYATTGKILVAYGPEGKVYVKNLSWYCDEVWVEGTYDETTGIISIPTGQFVSWNNGYYGVQLLWGSTQNVQQEDPETGEMVNKFIATADESVDTIELLVDEDKLYLLNAVGNTKDGYLNNYNATGLYLRYDNDKSFAAIEFPKTDEDGNALPFASIITIQSVVPANPTADDWYDCGDESGFSRFYFTLPSESTSGEALDPELLSYSIFTDNGNGPEIFTFSGVDYSFDLTSDQSITEVPYSLYSSAVDFKNYYVYMYRTNHDGYVPLFTKNIGIQVYYTVDGERTQSDIVWLYANEDGINDIKADRNADDNKVYNLAGQRLQKMQKGINIINGKKVLFK